MDNTQELARIEPHTEEQHTRARTHTDGCTEEKHTGERAKNVSSDVYLLGFVATNFVTVGEVESGELVPQLLLRLGDFLKRPLEFHVTWALIQRNKEIIIIH